ncbi:6154_t:CDS:2, partial [Dentiscutata heterogama]
PQVIIEPIPLTTFTRKTAVSEISTRATIDLCIINKVLSIVQDNSVKLNQLSRHCAKLEYLIKEQQIQLEEVSKKFAEINELETKKDNRKKPLKNTEDIYFQ